MHKLTLQTLAKWTTDMPSLLRVMQIESGLKASSKNPVSGAYGLIQFMPSLLKRYGVTQTDLPDEFSQLALVERYFKAVEEVTKPMSEWEPEDWYLAVFWPAALVGKRIEGGEVYSQNLGLDVDEDGDIDRDDIRAKMESMTVPYEVPTPTWPEHVAGEALRWCWCGPKQDPDRYIDLLWRGTHDVDKSYYMGGPSTCALFALAVLRKCQCGDPLVSNRYVLGQAVSDVMHLSGQHRSNTDCLATGDIVVVTGPEHVSVVVDVDHEHGTASVAHGGQGPGGAYTRYAANVPFSSKSFGGRSLLAVVTTW